MKKKHLRSTISGNLMWEMSDRSPEALQEMIERYKERYPDLVDWKFHVVFGYHDEGTEMVLTAERIETDKEFNRRKATVLKAKIAATKRKRLLKTKTELEEIKLLKKLQKKYKTGQYKKPE